MKSRQWSPQAGRATANFYVIAMFAIAVACGIAMAGGVIKPFPSLDWVFFVVPLLWLTWIGRSLFRIVRGFVRIGVNLLNAYRDVRQGEVAR